MKKRCKATKLVTVGIMILAIITGCSALAIPNDVGVHLVIPAQKILYGAVQRFGWTPTCITGAILCLAIAIIIYVSDACAGNINLIEKGNEV